jgi:hypothetical protein
MPVWSGLAVGHFSFLVCWGNKKMIFHGVGRKQNGNGNGNEHEDGNTLPFPYFHRQSEQGSSLYFHRQLEQGWQRRRRPRRRRKEG